MAKVYLVGAGPGATDLLTLRAARILAEADIVFYDDLVAPETVALADHAVHVPVGKRCGRRSTAQQFINKRLVDAARTGQRVVRLKGGDPMLFGRAHEEITALVGAGIEVEVVPGVTAALAASAELGISLSRRAMARSVVFLTPRVAPGASESSWLAAATAADTAVFYMAGGELQAVASALIDAGKPRDLPVAIVRGATLDDGSHQFATLDDLAQERLALEIGDLPCLVAIGLVYREALEEARAPARSPASSSTGDDEMARVDAA